MSIYMMILIILVVCGSGLSYFIYEKTRDIDKAGLSLLAFLVVSLGILAYSKKENDSAQAAKLQLKSEKVAPH